MKTSPNELRKTLPCRTGWGKGRDKFSHLKEERDTPIDFLELLEELGIRDTLWCLRTQDYRDYCLFMAEVAELVLPSFEERYPQDTGPRLALASVGLWHEGVASDEQLAAASEMAEQSAREAHNLMQLDPTAVCAYTAALAAHHAALRVGGNAQQVADAAVYCAAYKAHPEGKDTSIVRIATQTDDGIGMGGPAHRASLAQWKIIDTLLRKYL